jgi:hypothetical protein
VSDHPEVPRVVFNDDGESMNVEQAVERFRLFLLADPGNVSTFTVEVEVNPCDCHQDIRGRTRLSRAFFGTLQRWLRFLQLVEPSL